MTKKQYKKLMRRMDELEALMQRILINQQGAPTYPAIPSIPMPWQYPTVTWDDGTGSPLPRRDRSVSNS